MLFKNLSIYGIGNLLALDGLEEKLQEVRFLAPGTHEMKTQGFVPVRDDLLVFRSHGHILLRFKQEKKVLPKTAIDQVVEARCDELEEQQGFRPGKKATKELRERAVDELLARALTTSKSTLVWFDVANKRMMIDTSSNPVCDDVIRVLLKCTDRLDLTHLKAWPGKVLGEWVDEAPTCFSVDDKVSLRYPNNRGTTVTYNKADLGAHRALEHIKAGAEVASLAMTYNDRLSFTVSPVQRLTSIKALDILKETQAVPDADAFENDFMLMAGECAKLIDAVIEAA